MFYFARPDVTGLPIADLVQGKVFFFRRGVWKCHGKGLNRKIWYMGEEKKLRRGIWKCHGKGHQGKARERGGRAADD